MNLVAHLSTSIPLTHSLTHALPPSLPPSLTHSLTHSLTRSLTPSLTHSLTHALTHIHKVAPLEKDLYIFRTPFRWADVFLTKASRGIENIADRGGLLGPAACLLSRLLLSLFSDKTIVVWFIYLLIKCTHIFSHPILRLFFSIAIAGALLTPPDGRVEEGRAKEQLRQLASNIEVRFSTFESALSPMLSDTHATMSPVICYLPQEYLSPLAQSTEAAVQRLVSEPHLRQLLGLRELIEGGLRELGVEESLQNLQSTVDQVINMCMFICLFICLCVYMHVYVCVCVCVCVCSYIVLTRKFSHAYTNARNNLCRPWIDFLTRCRRR